MKTHRTYITDVCGNYWVSQQYVLSSYSEKLNYCYIVTSTNVHVTEFKTMNLLFAKNFKKDYTVATKTTY